MVDTQHTSPLLTAQQAAEWLRLTETGVKDPLASLRRYVDQGRLRAFRCGRCLRFPVWELEAFVRREIEGGER